MYCTYSRGTGNCMKYISLKCKFGVDAAAKLQTAKIANYDSKNRLPLKRQDKKKTHLPPAWDNDAVAAPVHMAHLLCDGAGALDELPLGEAISGAELQGPRLLNQVDTAMAQLLHSCPYLETNLKSTTEHWLRPHPIVSFVHSQRATPSQSRPSLVRLSSSEWMKMMSSTLRAGMLAIHF